MMKNPYLSARAVRVCIVIFAALACVAYCALLIKIMVFKNVPPVTAGQLILSFGGANGGHPANVVPFATIVPYLLGDQGWLIGSINIFGNIGLLVPLGFLLPLVFRAITWKRALVLGIVAGLSIEILQTMLRVGIFDIDDVILNAFGVMVGYGAWTCLTAWIRERKYIYLLIAAVIGAIALAGAVYIADSWTRHVIHVPLGVDGDATAQ